MSIRQPSKSVEEVVAERGVTDRHAILQASVADTHHTFNALAVVYVSIEADRAVPMIAELLPKVMEALEYYGERGRAQVESLRRLRRGQPFDG